jgi:hypothetical protein
VADLGVSSAGPLGSATTELVNFFSNSESERLYP